jgi:hypothetical protein
MTLRRIHQVPDEGVSAAPDVAVHALTGDGERVT